jgi:hypothetical protein
VSFNSVFLLAAIQTMTNKQLVELFERYRRHHGKRDVDLIRCVEWALENGHLPEVKYDELVESYWLCELEERLGQLRDRQ